LRPFWGGVSLGDNFKTKATTFLLTSAVVFVLYSLFGIFGFVIVPLALGWISAYCLQGAVELLHIRLGLSKRIVAAFVCILLTAAVLAVAVIGGIKLIEEARGVLSSIGDAFSVVSQIWERAVDAVGNWLSIDIAAVKELTEGFAVQLAGGIASGIPALLASLAASLPSFAVSAVVYFLTVLYLSGDFANANKSILSLFDKNTSRLITQAKRRFISGCAAYLKAYLTVGLFSFTQLYFALTVMRVPYSFSIALLIAFLDLLPLVGMAAAVIPWALWCAATGQISMFIGLAVTFGVMSITRQIIEPKVVGNFIGLHPLVSLVSVCVGLRLMGIPGMFIFPIGVSVLLDMKKDGLILTDTN